jgi:hypothetical protein
VEELRTFTRVPVLVSIPRIVTDTDTRQMRRRLSLGSAAALLGLALIAMTFRAFAHENTLLASFLTRGPS